MSWTHFEPWRPITSCSTYGNVRLLQRQQPSSDLVRLPNGQQGPGFQFGFRLSHSLQQRGAPEFRYQRLSSQRNDARLRLLRVCEDLRKIEIIRDEHVSVRSRELANRIIRRIRRAEAGLMGAFVTCRDRKGNPTRSQVYVDEQPH